MAVNTDKLVAAVQGAVTVIERLLADNAALKAQIAGQPADTAAQDQTAVDAQADALAAEVAKVTG